MIHCRQQHVGSIASKVAHESGQAREHTPRVQVHDIDVVGNIRKMRTFACGQNEIDAVVSIRKLTGQLQKYFFCAAAAQRW